MEVARPDGATVTVTGVPARHGLAVPEGEEPMGGDVIGFMLTADGLPSVYISGDNQALELVTEVADRFAPVDTAILYLGGCRHDTMTQNVLWTLTSAQGAAAAKILDARRVVPAHFDSWAHVKEGRDDTEKAFAAAGLTDRLHFCRAGD